MTHKQFEQHKVQVAKLDSLIQVRKKLGTAQIMGLKVKSYNEETKEYEEWELVTRHSFPMQQVKKILMDNLKTRIDNDLERITQPQIA